MSICSACNRPAITQAMIDAHPWPEGTTMGDVGEAIRGGEAFPGHCDTRNPPHGCHYWEDRARRSENALSHIHEWVHVHGVALCPRGADTYGEGMRDAKQQVSALLVKREK